MNVAEAVGRQLVAHGVRQVFGVVGSGNFHLTNALISAGARFVATAHEAGAATMADAHARISGQLTVLSVHQGPGVTNALTGITEAAKSRTPLLVLVPEATSTQSNFFIDVPRIATAIGAEYLRIRPDRVTQDVTEACTLATRGAGRTVLLGLPLDVQNMPVSEAPVPAESTSAPRVLGPAGAGLAESGPAELGLAELGLAELGPAGADVEALVAALVAARRPVFIAGRGATRQPAVARAALADLAQSCGALLAVSAAAKGLFAGDPWYLDVSGGFATPLAAELISGSDLIVGWGSTLNMWTTRHGRLIHPGTVLAQVDIDPAALGVHRAIDVAVHGDLVAVAQACTAELARGGHRPADPAAPASAASASAASGKAGIGWRSASLRARIAAEGQWRSVSYVDDSDGKRIDPRTLTIELDDLLPEARTVVVDSGNFMGYPSMYLGVPDSAGFCFTQAYQSIGLGLAGALGAAIARPDRLTVAALGDGGFLMSAAELSTAAHAGGPLLIVVYNDAAYGAEVHHFGPDGFPLDTVTFPDTDLAAIATGFGLVSATVRTREDLVAVRDWLDGDRERPLLVDAKVTSAQGSWWLEEAFRGH